MFKVLILDSTTQMNSMYQMIHYSS